MSNSAILKSSLAKKYWMAATGLFLCLFLVGHLLGNLQLLIPGYSGRLLFNSYATFMVSNPFVDILSWLTYLSIIFHAIDGLLLTLKNRKSRSNRYAMNKSGRNSKWPARNMALLGTILLAFIIIHMSQFWYQYHYGTTPYMKTKDGSGYVVKSGGIALQSVRSVENATVKDGIIYNAQNQEVGPAMEDLYASVILAFNSLWMVILYVIAMFAIAFHLSHGFQSAFQSFGLRSGRYKTIIQKLGLIYCIVVPTLFAIIPIILFFRH